MQKKKEPLDYLINTLKRSDEFFEKLQNMTIEVMQKKYKHHYVYQQKELAFIFYHLRGYLSDLTPEIRQIALQNFRKYRRSAGAFVYLFLKKLVQSDHKVNELSKRVLQNFLKKEQLLHPKILPHFFDYLVFDGLMPLDN